MKNYYNIASCTGYGYPDELLSRGTIYSQLYNSQFEVAV